MPNYFVITEFTAPKKSVVENGDRLQRVFKVGELIAGKSDGHGKLKGQFVNIILTHDGYVIPANNLEQVKTKDTSDNAEGDVVDMHSKVTDIVDREFVKDLMDTSKKSMSGVVVGAFSGFALALFKGKSLFWFGLIGATAGGLIGYSISKKDKK